MPSAICRLDRDYRLIVLDFLVESWTCCHCCNGRGLRGSAFVTRNMDEVYAGEYDGLTEED